MIILTYKSVKKMYSKEAALKSRKTVKSKRELSTLKSIDFIKSFLSAETEIATRDLMKLTGYSQSFVRRIIDKLDIEGTAIKSKRNSQRGGHVVFVRLRTESDI